MADSYFLFSKQQLNIRQQTAAKSGRRFNSGSVVVQGVMRPYTEISDKPESMYSDFVVVAKADLDKVKYTEPITD